MLTIHHSRSHRQHSSHTRDLPLRLYILPKVSLLHYGFLVTMRLSHLAIISSPSIIFTSYRNETGWSSKGYVYLLGWVLTSIATGQDIAGHLAEEAKHPTKTVPIGVFWGTAISYLVGWVVMLCLMAVSPLFLLPSGLPIPYALIPLIR